MQRPPLPASPAHLKGASGQLVELVRNRVYVFGRAETCDIRTDDPGCSRQHFKISVSGDGRMLFLEDLGSKNGTRVNGAASEGRTLLKSGDMIQAGGVSYLVEIAEREGSEQMDTRTTFFGR